MRSDSNNVVDEGDYVESTTSITADQKAHNLVTRDNKLKEDAPSSLDSNEPDRRKEA